MKTYELASYITLFSFSSTLLINSLLIYLTIRKIQLIHGPYKWMIVLFAFIGILLSFVEVTFQPCIHNFNAAFMFFSLNEYLPNWLLSFGIACYGGFISVILTFVAMQFLFRCWTLSNDPWTTSFQGVRVLLWVAFVLTPSVCYVILTYLLISPEEFTDGYMEKEILEVYNLKIADAPRFIMVAYNNQDFDIRWRNSLFVASTCSIVTMSFITITYCALRMRREMKTCMKKLSQRNLRLETQFFKALLAQSAFPTFLLVLPTGPVVFLPFLDLQVSLQSGFLFSIFSFYPPIDSIAMMVIITEYKVHIKNLLFQLRHPCTAMENPVGVGNSFQLTSVSTIPVEQMDAANTTFSKRTVSIV